MGSLFCAVAQNTATFIIGRAITGLGIAAWSAIGVFLLVTTTVANNRLLYFALLVGAENIGLAVGPIAASLVSQRLGFRWSFIVPMPLAVLAAGFIAWTLHGVSFARQPSGERLGVFDIIGCLCFTSSVVSLMLAMHFLQTATDYKSDPTWICLIGSMCSVMIVSSYNMVFTPRNRYIPLILRDKEGWLCLSIGCCLSCATFIFYYFTSLCLWVGTVAPIL